jgi:hypothetical protein
VQPDAVPLDQREQRVARLVSHGHRQPPDLGMGARAEEPAHLVQYRVHPVVAEAQAVADFLVRRDALDHWLAQVAPVAEDVDRIDRIR